MGNQDGHGPKDTRNQRTQDSRSQYCSKIATFTDEITNLLNQTSNKRDELS